MKEFFKIRSKKANRARIQVITIAVSLMLVAAIAIGGTVAWLVDKTESVTNTFTFGDINITLKETNVEDGEPELDASEEAKAQTYANLVPGATVPKDPKVTVDNDSVDCWLFVKVTPGNNTFTPSGSNTAINILEWTMATGWDEVADGVYGRKVLTTDNTKEFSVFENDQVIVSSKVTKDLIDTYNNATNPATKPTITITAYAIQSEYLTDTNGTTITTAEDAWALINPQP